MSDMPPDSNGSGASPAEPDQPTQAPPRPATNGSRAVTSPPGLRCQRDSPSGPTTWSTGSRLATTTTGLSAAMCRACLSAIPPPTLPTAPRRIRLASDQTAESVTRRGRAHTQDQGGGEIGKRVPRDLLLHHPHDVVAERRKGGQGTAEPGADQGHHPGRRRGHPEDQSEDRAAGDVDRQCAQTRGPAAPGDGQPVGQQPQRCPDQRPRHHQQRRHDSPSPARSSASMESAARITARPVSSPATTANRPPSTEASTYATASTWWPDPVSRTTSMAKVE